VLGCLAIDGKYIGNVKIFNNQANLDNVPGPTASVCK